MHELKIKHEFKNKRNSQGKSHIPLLIPWERTEEKFCAETGEEFITT